jgi:hypothetical protein
MTITPTVAEAALLMNEGWRFFEDGHTIAATATVRAAFERTLRNSLGKPKSRNGAGQLATDAYRAGRIRRSTEEKVRMICAHLSASIHGDLVPRNEVETTLLLAEGALERLTKELDA